MNEVRPLLEAALAHHRAGRLADAAAGYASVLARDPAELNAIYLSGVLAAQRGDPATAVERIGRAIAAKPDVPDFHNNLGEALRALCRLDEAEAAYRRALALDPEHAGALANLGTLSRTRRDLRQAIQLYRRALAREPDRAAHHNNLAAALSETGDLAGAEAGFRAALAREPDYVEAINGLATVLRLLNRTAEAQPLHARALALAPDDPDVLRSAAMTTARDGALAEAERLYRRNLALKPDDSETMSALAAVTVARGDMDETIALLDRAVASPSPDDPRRPAMLASARLMTLLCASAPASDWLVAEHRRWVATYAAAFEASPPAHANDRAPQAGQPGHRRLRIGFVSPDFRSHSVAVFFAPFIEALDRACFDVVCYAETLVADRVTERIKACTVAWRPTLGVDDAAVAAQIRADAIDILVDLAGHTGDNRLLVFARRPAPVQATWLGYPGTTGLSAIDWRISDAACDPPEDDAASSERVMRLPGFHCFEPPKMAPDVTPLPAAASGRITLGSFNNLAKLSDACVALYASVLRAIPAAQLLLKSSGRADLPTFERQVARIAAHGIAPARIVPVPFAPDPAAHLATYGRVDLALDTFPYCGTTTTCESLWMGVPVVTLSGDRHAARVGASLLGQVGLHDFIARTPEGYAAIAASWAARPADLAALRAGLRARMAASPLCDAPGFARRMEDAFRAMWRAWCGPE